MSVALNEAVKIGDLSLLIKLREEGHEWHRTTCMIAAGIGHLHILKYLHENGCEWDWTTCVAASKNGHLECLKYAHENGCHINALCVTREAAEGGHFECLKYAVENGAPINFWTCSYAVKKGNLDCLKYLREKGCEFDRTLCAWCIAGGYLECLKYALENGAIIDMDTLSVCGVHAGVKSVDCFEYFYRYYLLTNSVESFWSKFSDLIYGKVLLPKEFVDKINLDDQLWSDTLFNVNLRRHPHLKEKVEKRRKEIKEECEKSLKHVLLEDITKYCVLPFI